MVIFVAEGGTKLPYSGGLGSHSCIACRMCTRLLSQQDQIKLRGTEFQFVILFYALPGLRSFTLSFSSGRYGKLQRNETSNARVRLWRVLHERLCLR